MNREWRSEDSGDPYFSGFQNKRWVMKFGDKAFVSVLLQMTGFGYHEWESSLVMEDGCKVILGDHRKAVEGMTEKEVIEYFNEDHEKNSMETILDKMKSDEHS